MGSFLRSLPCVSFVLLLWLPQLDELVPLCPEFPLAGVEDVAGAPVQTSLRTWHSGELQQDLEARLGRALGLRDWMVRLDNEVRFDAMGVGKGEVVVGRDDWLFTPGYLPAQQHQIGEDGPRLLLRLCNLRLLQDTLQEHGVIALLLLSPNKASIYPEQLPWLHREVRALQRDTLYGLLTTAAPVGNLRMLDCRRLFEQWKATAGDFPLFPRGGIHWSRYSGARVAVELLGSLGRGLGVEIRTPELAPPKVLDVPLGSDADLVGLANLLGLGRLAERTLQPVLAARPGDAGRQVGVLFVGTSFIWNLTDVLEDGFADPLTVFYYFKGQYVFQGGKRGPRTDIDKDPAALRAAILRHQAVVIECNESTLRDLGSGFVEAALAAFGRTPLTSLPFGPGALGR